MTERLIHSSEHYYLSIIPDKVVEESRTRHNNPKRYYHNWTHLQEMFLQLEQVDEFISCLPGVILAVLYHDAVYEARRQDNEVRSAALMRKMTKGMDQFYVERADSLILATQTHAIPQNFPEEARSDAAYFLDIDMSILGAPLERYTEYVQQVRQEYGYVSEEKFREGRLKVLRGFMQRPAIYLSPWGAANLEGPARRNIQAEIDALESPDDA